jgi:hypothetical protein
MHPRKAIRHASVALLVNATSAADRVRPTRTDPIRAGSLPAIGVYTLMDDVNIELSSPREEQHDLQLEIAGWVADTAALPVDDAMDDLAEQIEAAMAADRFLGGAAGDQGALLQRTEMQVLAENGADPLVGVVTLTYHVVYFVVPGATSPVNDFLRTGVTTQIDGAGVNNTVSDLINQRP